MKNGKFRIILGIILVVLQLVNLFCMDSLDIHFWDSNENNHSLVPVQPASPNLTMLSFGFALGQTKFFTAFQELPEALEEQADTGYYFRTLSSTEYTSLYIREGLAAGEGFAPTALYVYDFLVALGYFLYGIIGIFLIVSGNRAKRQFDASFLHPYYVDTPISALKLFGLVVCSVFLITFLIGQTKTYFFYLKHDIHYQLDIFWLPVTVMPICYIILGIFFLHYYGKKSSILPCSVLLFYAAGCLLSGISDLSPQNIIDLIDMALRLDMPFVAGYFYEGLCNLLSGILLLIAGSLLYSSGSKRIAKFLVLGGMVADVVGQILYAVPRMAAYDVPLPLAVVEHFMFAALLILYMWVGKTSIPEEEKKHRETPAFKTGCPSCGAPVGPGRIRCLRCGNVIAAAPQSANLQPEPVSQNGNTEEPLSPDKEERQPLTPEVPQQQEPPAVPPVEDIPQPVQPEELPEPQPPVQPKSVPQKDKPRFCYMCGKPLTPEHVFCGFCGTKVPEVQ